VGELIEYNRKLCLNIFIPMPKLKSRKAAAKRFRASGSGKIIRRKAFKSHLLEHKSSDLRNKLSKAVVVDETDVARVRGMLPYL
jgi:large subunit ribosomal protein L35